MFERVLNTPLLESVVTEKLSGDQAEHYGSLETTYIFINHSNTISFRYIYVFLIY